MRADCASTATQDLGRKELRGHAGWAARQGNRQATERRAMCAGARGVPVVDLSDRKEG